MTPQKKKPGPPKGTGGRPKGDQKIRLTLRILPATREWLGVNPSARLDSMAQESAPK